MNIQALWVSGSIDSWSSTVNSSKNGEKGGIALSHETLQLNDIRRSGIVLSRWYYDFPHQEEQSFTTREENAPFKVIVRPEEVADLLMLTVDGKVVLERVMADENGDPQLSENGVLCNMLLPNMDAVEGDILEPTAEPAGPSEPAVDAPDVNGSAAVEDEESPKSETEDVDQATGPTDGLDVGGAITPDADDSSADVSDFVDLGDVEEDESERDDTDVSGDFAPDDSDIDAQADEFAPEGDADDSANGGGEDEDDGFNLDW